MDFPYPSAIGSGEWQPQPPANGSFSVSGWIGAPPMPPCANPKIEEWLIEWGNDARNKSNERFAFACGRALTSLRAHQGVLGSGAECAKLKHFRHVMCEKVDKAFAREKSGILGNKKYGRRGAAPASVPKVRANVKSGYRKRKSALAPLEGRPHDKGEVREVESSSSSYSRKRKESAPSPRSTEEPGQCEVILCVDKCEVNRKRRKPADEEDELINALKDTQIPFQVTMLNLGDFIWIRRTSTGQELVLPFVVERKRADDLSRSIKDGRYLQQKRRLAKLHAEHNLRPIYLLEAYGYKGSDWGLQRGGLKQALADTQMTEGFLVQETGSLQDTVDYLKTMTLQLTKLFTKGVPKGLLTLEEFNRASIKTRNWTVAEMWAKHLLRLRGVTPYKAKAIVDRYPTPYALMQGFKECEGDKERETLLLTLCFGKEGCTWKGETEARALSKAIAKLYTNKFNYSMK